MTRTISGNAITLPKLFSDAEYVCQIAAKNKFGTSDFSEKITFTTLAEKTSEPDESAGAPAEDNPATGIGAAFTSAAALGIVLFAVSHKRK